MQQHSECEESQVAWLQRFSLPAEKAWRNNMFIKGAESCISSHRMYAELVTPKGCSDRSVSGSLPPINLQIHHWPYTWAQRNWLLISWHCFQPLYCPILPLASCPHLILPSYTSLDFLFISASIVGLLNDDTTMSWAMTCPSTSGGISSHGPASDHPGAILPYSTLLFQHLGRTFMPSKAYQNNMRNLYPKHST